MFLIIGCNKESEEKEAEDAGNPEEEMSQIDQETEDEEADSSEEESEDFTFIDELDEATVLNDLDATALDDYDEKKWRKLSQENGIEGRIFYGDQKLLQSETGSPGPGTYLFDLEENGPIWQQDRISYFGSSHLLLEDGILYVANSDKIIGLDDETGETVKEYPLSESSTVSEIYLFEEYLLVGYGEDLILFDKETEEQLWETPFHPIRAISNSTHNVYLEDGVFITSYYGDKIVGIDEKTGDELWEIETPDSTIESFLVDEDVIYLFNGVHQLEAGGMRAASITMFDASSQEEIDEVVFGEGGSPVGNGSFATEDGQIIFHEADGLDQSIVSADPDLTKENWIVKGEDYYLQDMLYENGKIYVIAEDLEEKEYFLIIIDASSGEVEEKIILEDGKNDDPNTFYTYDGKVYIHMTIGSNFYYIFDEEDVHRPLP